MSCPPTDREAVLLLGFFLAFFVTGLLAGGCAGVGVGRGRERRALARRLAAEVAVGPVAHRQIADVFRAAERAALQQFLRR